MLLVPLGCSADCMRESGQSSAARGTGRKREMAMRPLPWAPRAAELSANHWWKLFAWIVGRRCGALFASIGISAFQQMAPAFTPRLEEIAPDPRCFWFALVSSLLAGVLFGLVPALRASRSDPNSALKEGVGGSVSEMAGTGQMRLGSVLVISEIALAFRAAHRRGGYGRRTCQALKDRNRKFARIIS